MVPEYIAGIVSAVAVLILILSGYLRGEGGFQRAARMFGGGILIAAVMVILARLFERS